jgi:hypothetical protein
MSKTNHLQNVSHIFPLVSFHILNDQFLTVLPIPRVAAYHAKT